MNEVCLICGDPARRKCTRCGEAFCDVHVRYGNPHFELQAPQVGVGYYCDHCWDAYWQEGQRQQRLMTVFCILGALVALGAATAAIWLTVAPVWTPGY